MDKINVEKRDERTKAKQLRRSGLVPCCVYGGSLPESISIQMEMKTADLLLREKREGSKVQLVLDGKTIPTQIKQATRSFLKNEVEHISFQALSADQKVNSVAHILVKNGETVPGILEQMIFEVPFAALPADMVDTVMVDAAGLKVGDAVTVADLPELMNGRLELQLPEDSLVLKLQEKRTAEEPAEDSGE